MSKRLEGAWLPLTFARFRLQYKLLEDRFWSGLFPMPLAACGCEASGLRFVTQGDHHSNLFVEV
jgi:hypothetical protein